MICKHECRTVIHLLPPSIERHEVTEWYEPEIVHTSRALWQKVLDAGADMAEIAAFIILILQVVGLIRLG